MTDVTIAMLGVLNRDLAVARRRVAELEQRRAELLPGYYTDAAYLCCECGTISRAAAWVAVRVDEELDRPVLDETGEDDPTLRCPACQHDHRDDDSGAGMVGDTVEECLREVPRLLEERTAQHGVDWLEIWLDKWDERADAIRAELRQGEATT